MGATWGQVGLPNFTFMLRSCLKRALEGIWRHFSRVLKVDLNIEGSWDRFLINFGTVSGGAGEAKKRLSLETGYNFHISAMLL